jgi:peroxiredoxin
LERLHQEMKQEPFVLLAVDIEEERQKVRRFAADKGLTFSILLDEKGWVADLYRIRALPAAVLVNAQGEVWAVTAGYRHWDAGEMRKLVKAPLSPS